MRRRVAFTVSTVVDALLPLSSIPPRFVDSSQSVSGSPTRPPYTPHAARKPAKRSKLFRRLCCPLPKDALEVFTMSTALGAVCYAGEPHYLFIRRPARTLTLYVGGAVFVVIREGGGSTLKVTSSG